MKQKDCAHANYLQAHFQILQQQINPHFLYNTLDTIVWMTFEKRSEDVIELVEALSTFFRLNLSRGAEIVSVSDSVLCLKSYLAVQKMRYADSLNFQIEIDEEIVNDKLLKLLLQPVVENALYHGIREKGRGTINISGIGTEELLIFSISDDGTGIPEELLIKIQSMLETPHNFDGIQDDAYHGFGLHNVQQRIQLYYGTEYGLKIDSTFGIGTKIIITLPRKH